MGAFGDIPLGASKHGFWQWEQNPDGEWTLIWIEQQTHYHWKWQRPNAYRWSGPHRRRGTWMDVSGKDFQDGTHQLHQHMLSDEDMKKFMKNEPDESWNKGMVPPCWSSWKGNAHTKASRRANSVSNRIPNGSSQCCSCSRR